MIEVTPLNLPKKLQSYTTVQRVGRSAMHNSARARKPLKCSHSGSSNGGNDPSDLRHTHTPRCHVGGSKAQVGRASGSGTTWKCNLCNLYHSTARWIDDIPADTIELNLYCDPASDIPMRR
ncbi:unnamed protein product [Ceratitis capitata]|uniref:(Mediterranean fruit fly) hypothetical protein n=1 Tax=Ceratitis capitata TaxID=7213 RepID=A0A811V3L5_CERCA|nr:unnamed protein product [Ceratitis capitata]